MITESAQAHALNYTNCMNWIWISIKCILNNFNMSKVRGGKENTAHRYTRTANEKNRRN